MFENTESTARQYALRERALALGWAQERILVIDQDLGHSAASTADRLGFQRLVASVGLGQVGLVLGLEVSRLARNGSRLASIVGNVCADPDLDSRRGGSLRSLYLQRQAFARIERSYVRSRAFCDARPEASEASSTKRGVALSN